MAMNDNRNLETAMDPEAWRDGPEQFEPSSAHYEAAMEWLVQLRDADQATSRAFEEWKRANPAHEFAFAEIEAMFTVTSRPSQDAVQHYHRHWRPVRRNPLWRYAGIGIAASIVALLISPFADDLRFIGADATTRAGEMRAVMLSDGSRVTLNSASVMDVDITSDHRGVRLLRGEAYFEVAKNPAKPFTVQAGKASVRVLGTKFNIRLDDDQTVVSVNEGRVRTASVGDPGGAVVLQAGQEAMVTNSRVQMRDLNDFVTSAWRRHEMTFQQVPLRLVVQQINRYRRAPIYIVNQALVNHRVTGIFSTQDSDETLRILRESLGIEAVTLPTGQTLLY
jgi:transmembrane sensor